MSRQQCLQTVSKIAIGCSQGVKSTLTEEVKLRLTNLVYRPVHTYIMSIVSQNTTYNTAEKGPKRGTDWDRYVYVTKQSRRTAKNRI